MLILKQFRNSLSPYLTSLISLSWSTDELPSLLIVSKVTPAKRSSNRMESNNYRPIYLLSNISKVIEKVIYQRLHLYFETKSIILYKLHLGFQNNCSITHALMLINQNLKDSWDKGLFTCGAHLDLKKSFWYCQLRYFYLLNWIIIVWESLFPQGSVFRLLLFFIFINDLRIFITLRNFDCVMVKSKQNKSQHKWNRNYFFCSKKKTGIKHVNFW